MKLRRKEKGDDVGDDGVVYPFFDFVDQKGMVHSIKCPFKINKNQIHPLFGSIMGEDNRGHGIVFALETKLVFGQGSDGINPLLKKRKEGSLK